MEEQQYQWQIRQRYHQYRYHVDQELRRRGYNTGEEEVGAPPSMNAPPPPPLAATMRDGGLGPSDEIADPTYVNLNFLKAQHMQQSTRL
ncbi:unnamed protein product [Nippostrongylus brasiliensis]|uniref:Striatin domain-containing protein n=1 Tax=Nippostrongylus brasiliensis TaxID=27835 RepID=A0A0N4YCP3_NIPBR|nr:unnamed protein product [Nippostrongylus brasiliensis]